MDTYAVVAIVVAVASVILGYVSLNIDRHQWKALRKLGDDTQAAIEEWKGKGDFGDQLNDYLLHKEKPEDPTNLEVISGMAGQAIAKSMTMSMAGQASGDARHVKMIEGRVMEATIDSNPELKVISGLAKKFGLEDLLNPKDLPDLITVLQKHGLLQAGLGQSIPNNGNGVW